MNRRFLALLCASAGVAVAVSACGGGNSSGPVAGAAAVTKGSGGYKMSGVMSVTGAANPVTASMTAAVNASSGSGTMTVHEVVGSKRVDAPMIFSGQSFWMRSSAIAGAANRTGGKPWIYVDMSKALGGIGVASLPSTVNPSQFLNYLGSVGASPSRVGTQTIHGVRTTEYRAKIDLGSYAQRFHVPPKTISSLESAMGGTSIPVQAWIDGRHRVRRIHVAFPECVQGSKLQFSMTLGIYDFGPKPSAQIPSQSDVYNLTPLLATASRTLRLGC